MRPANLVNDLQWILANKRKNKYGAKRCRIDDIGFDSMMEGRRYVQLKHLRDIAGQVLMFIRQPTFDLGGGTTYKADFLIFWKDGRVTVEDVKGQRTKAFIKAKKQVEALYPITIQEVKA